MELDDMLTKLGLLQRHFDNFCSKIDFPDDWETNPAGECWIWTGHKNKKNELIFNVNHHPHYVRNVSYYLYFGIKAYRLFNLCENILCINPHHQLENPNLSRSKEYKIFHHILQRLFNPNNADFINYGGRGIDCDPRYNPAILNKKVLPFQNFVADLKELGIYPIPNGMTIDRIDNNRGYWIDNIRLATKQEQNQNNRWNVVTPDIVREIRNKYSSGNYTQEQLSVEYNATQPQISNIIRKQCWYNVI